MFGLSFLELVVIGTVALLLFGPEKLPEMARTMGKITGELQKHIQQFRREMYNSVYKPADEIKTNVRESLRTELNTLKTPSPEKQISASDESKKKAEGENGEENK